MSHHHILHCNGLLLLGLVATMAHAQPGPRLGQPGPALPEAPSTSFLEEEIQARNELELWQLRRRIAEEKAGEAGALLSELTTRHKMQNLKLPPELPAMASSVQGNLGDEPSWSVGDASPQARELRLHWIGQGAERDRAVISLRGHYLEVGIGQQVGNLVVEEIHSDTIVVSLGTRRIRLGIGQHGRGGHGP